MLGVEQIRTLEGRIEKALSFIAGLRVENAALQTKAEASDEARGRAEERAVAAESRVRELEEAIAVFKRDQSRIEEGILHALEKLDAFEDLVLKGPSKAEPKAESSAVERVASMPEAAPLPTPSPAPAEDSTEADDPTEADDLTALDGPGSHGEADREEDSVGVPAEEAFHGGQPATPRPEPAGTESKRPEPARTAAPQSAPDELGIF
ncbi:MAG: hypothetical protein M0001_16130 [Treponema sp.]|nr:hypothetical protein [Treponema sp.]